MCVCVRACVCECRWRRALSRGALPSKCAPGCECQQIRGMPHSLLGALYKAHIVGRARALRQLEPRFETAAELQGRDGPAFWGCFGAHGRCREDDAAGRRRSRGRQHKQGTPKLPNSHGRQHPTPTADSTNKAQPKKTALEYRGKGYMQGSAFPPPLPSSPSPCFHTQTQIAMHEQMRTESSALAAARPSPLASFSSENAAGSACLTTSVGRAGHSVRASTSSRSTSSGRPRGLLWLAQCAKFCAAAAAAAAAAGFACRKGRL